MTDAIDYLWHVVFTDGHGEYVEAPNASCAEVLAAKRRHDAGARSFVQLHSRTIRRVAEDDRERVRAKWKGFAFRRGLRT